MSNGSSRHKPPGGRGRQLTATLGAVLAAISLFLFLVIVLGVSPINMDAPAVSQAIAALDEETRVMDEETHATETQADDIDIPIEATGKQESNDSDHATTEALPLAMSAGSAEEFVTTAGALASGEQVDIRWDNQTGIPSFITGSMMLPGGADIAESTQAFFEMNKDLFQMNDPFSELEVGRLEQDNLRMTHVHLAQMHEGVPVFGKELAVHIDPEGMIASINGDYQPGIDLSTQPEINMDAALDTAMNDSNDVAESSAQEPPQLVVLVQDGDEAHLTWKVTLAEDDPPFLTVYFVDAHTGKIAAKHDNLQDAKNRQTYNANYGSSIPGTLALSEGGAWTGDAVINAAHYNAGLTYDYLNNTFGRDSLNGSGMTLKSTVHYQSNYNNAFWNGYQMTYGDGDGYVFGPLGSALDIVAHEMFHGVTQYTAGLIYSYQSGALNESYSDVLGAMVDRDDWLLGEDAYTPQTPGDALRSLSNPAQFGQPAHMNNYVNTSSDNGGVHTNSGIPNKAAYNIAMAIGKEKMEQIWYRTLTNYLTPSSDFADARDASVQAASDLYGASSAEVAAVTSGFAAVGINGSGPPSETTARVEISHTYRGDLVVTLGVGNPDSPTWSTTVSNRQGGSTDNINATVDIAGGAAKLPPDWSNRWYLKVYDAAGYDTGQITKFTITDHGTTYTATDVPVAINDYQTAYSYIPTADNTPPSLTGSSPAANAVDVYASLPVTATFSEGIMSSTLNSTSFRLVEKGSGEPVPSQITYDSSAMTASIRPDRDLDYSTDYTVAVSNTITDLAGNPLDRSHTWDFTTAPPPKFYYLNWYDMASLNMRNWMVMGNPSTNSNTAGFDIFIGNERVNAAPLEAVPNSTNVATYPGKIGGPVKVASLKGTSQMISSRSLFGNSLEEVIAIEESRLDSNYYFTWYDSLSQGVSDWIMVGNPGSSTVAVDLYIAGEKVNGAPYLVAPGSSVTPEFDGLMGGPVQIIAYEPGNPSLPRNVLASQRIIWNGEFNEVAGIPASELSSEFIYSWYDQHSVGARNWILVSNPHSDKQLAAEIWIGGERMRDSTTGNSYFLVSPGTSIDTNFPSVMNGPVKVKGYDAASYDPGNPGSPDLDFYTTQRSLFGGSFEEVLGYPTEQLASDYHYSWYDESAAGVRNWILVANPGDVNVVAEIWIAGTLMDSLTLAPGASLTPSYPGVINGPVEIKGYNAITYSVGSPPDTNIYTSQRVLWNGSFNEVAGTVLD